MMLGKPVRGLFAIICALAAVLVFCGESMDAEAKGPKNVPILEAVESRSTASPAVRESKNTSSPSAGESRNTSSPDTGEPKNTPVSTAEESKNAASPSAWESNISAPASEENGKPVVKLLPVYNNYGENNINPYDALKVPTQYVKLGDHYVIVDAYHDQVIYSPNPRREIREWRVMAGGLKNPHAIAYDGKEYLIADTDNNRVLVCEWICGRFQKTQSIENIGIRPHYIEYDPETKSFFVWSSMTGEMYILRQNEETGIFTVAEVRSIPELRGFYVRSFKLCDDLILFPSGTNCHILLVDKKTFAVLQRYPVPEEMASMAYITPIGTYFYITVACDIHADQEKAMFIRTKDLSGLARGRYENLDSMRGEGGVPYYIDMVDGSYYMTNHGTSVNVFRIDVVNDRIVSMQKAY